MIQRTAVAMLAFTLLFSTGCRELEYTKEATPESSADPIAPLQPAPGTELRMQNYAALTASLNVESYHQAGFRGQNVTIAVLDNGYEGLNESLGITLPPGLQIEAAADPRPAQSIHGTKMAEIAYAIASGGVRYIPGRAAPDLKLYLTNGPYANLERAVQQLIALKKAQPERQIIALYAQIWEFGGNGDGRGYINQLVNKAIDSGVLWVNAAGNLGKSTYIAPVQIQANGELKLPFADRYVRFKVSAANTPVKIVLGWDDFSDSYQFYRTNRDLDLYLENDAGKAIGQGTLIQDGKDHGTTTGYSRHARELLQAQLSAGTYRLRVVAKSQNFAADSRFWLTAAGSGVVLDQSNGDEHVFAPADNPRVLTIGALDVAYSNSRRDSSGALTKPECMTPSKVDFGQGFNAEGTSTAAALAVGLLATYSSAVGAISKAQIDIALVNGQMGVAATTVGGPEGFTALRLPTLSRQN